MNAECALFGHQWFWRHAIRNRMCSRCWRLDVTPPTPRAAQDAVPPAVPPAQHERPEVALSPSRLG